MPYRFVLHLNGPNGAHEGLTGPKLHGLVLANLERTAPSLSAAVHAAHPSSPLVVAEGGTVDETASFEIGVLDDDLAGDFGDALPPGGQISVGEHNAVIADRAVYGQRYDELLDRAPDDGSWELELRSPTTFRLPSTTGARRAQPLPLPELVFGSLQRRWQRFAPAGLLPDLDEAIASHLAIARADLRTKRFLTKPPRVWQLGSVGRVRYTLVQGRTRPAEERRGLSALMMLAPFSGVGDATTKGMGHVMVRPAS